MKARSTGFLRPKLRVKSLQKKELYKNSLNQDRYSHIDFSLVRKLASKFADYIEANFEEVAAILLQYESFEVVKDETNRTLDLLRSLNENREFFALRAGAITAFLPKNQPLYALTCFVIVPSLMATEVHFRVPHAMRHFFPQLLRCLKIDNFFPNIFVSGKERLDFLTERTALWTDEKTGETLPVTDAVIFTGTSYHADKLRLVFDQRTLFITNGSGHNPVVVTDTASVKEAVAATLKLQLYNQGQDCANPNSILVHKKVYEDFLDLLRAEIKKVNIGHYSNRDCRVGPISEPTELERIQRILIENRHWIDPSTPGLINTTEAIVMPTIICKPLKEGGNYTEAFAPLIFVQKYEKDTDLNSYFENAHYTRNAMYVTVYGESSYVRSLINKEVKGKILHDKTTIILNTHLHAPGVERGTQPYGGYGYGASSLSLNGHVVAKPTLPQRDIFQYVIKPLLEPGALKKRKDLQQRVTKICTKNIKKVLNIRSMQEAKDEMRHGKIYADVLAIVGSEGQRYVELGADRIFTLLSTCNIEHAAKIEPKHIQQIHRLRNFLRQNKKIEYSVFQQFLYALPKKEGATEQENRQEQLVFFRHLYQLLLGKDSGPRLARFLIDADRINVIELLKV